MAKAKKEKLSLEELLKHALVKEEDRPYEVPENWVWSRLGYISEIVTGGTPSKSYEEYYGGKFPFVKPADLDQGRHVVNATEYLSDAGRSVSRIIPYGSTSVCCIGTIGKCGYLEFDATTNQQINSIISSRIKNLFIYYYCCTDYFLNYLTSLASATTISIVNKGKMATVPIPVPPLMEQQRIVDVIDSLFEKLDKAKELVQNALDSFESRKAAILHKAYTGELTAKWREENGVCSNSWEKKELKKLCDKITDGTHKSPKNYKSGDYMYITAKNIKEYGADLNNITYVSENDHKEIYSRCNVEYGDVLYIKDGATTGIATINTINKEFSLLSSVALLKPNKNKLDAKYLVYDLNSPNTKGLMINKMSGNAITRLTLNKIKDTVITVPSLDEQKEIVRILNNLLENEQRAKELCDVIGKIDLMKKAILARAFRGELGTNNPNEESAVELLKEVLKEKD